MGNHREMSNDLGHLSDGYHTFDELCAHRIELWIALCRMLQLNTYHGVPYPWRSRLHSDGSSFDGWFVLGYGTADGKQITYHIPDSRWNDCDEFATFEKAPDWDGHTPADVVKRLKEL